MHTKSISMTASLFFLIFCSFFIASADETVTMMTGEPKITVPKDAILVPFSTDNIAPAKLPKAADLTHAEQMLLVPSKPYLDKLEAVRKAGLKLPEALPKSPVPYAVSAAEYRTELSAGEKDDLKIDGKIRLDVFVDKPALVPLTLRGGVYDNLFLDGKPAAIQSLDANRLAVLVQGVGAHELTFAVRTRIEKQGGWRIVGGTLPTGGTSKVSLALDGNDMDLLTSNPLDKKKWSSAKDKNIVTSLTPNGDFRWQWRSQISEGTVDRSLEVDSSVRMDIQEDGFRANWILNLRMSRGKWEMFRLRLPKDYAITEVAGENVRGWEIVPKTDGTDTVVDIELLKPAEKTEHLVVGLWKSSDPKLDPMQYAESAVPKITVEDSAIHRGRIDLYRSPILDVRVDSAEGVSQTDRIENPAPASQTTPLGIKPFQSYRFSSEAYKIAFRSKQIPLAVKATVNSLLKISKTDCVTETRFALGSPDRPLYGAVIQVPEGFKPSSVVVPDGGTWTLEQRNGKPAICVRFSVGTSMADILVEGPIVWKPETMKLDHLPVFIVQDAKEQRTELAVQTDPSLDVQGENISGCRSEPVGTVFGWVSSKEQRDMTRLVYVAEKTPFDATLVLTQRKPEVRASSISNVRATSQTLDETILIDFEITKAGIKTVEFVLPGWMKDAKIEVPMLRRKTVAPVDPNIPDGDVLVKLELDEEIMNQLRILVRSDRLVKPEVDYPVLVPIIKTGQVQRQYVVLENDKLSPDEMVVDRMSLKNFRELSRQQKEWAYLASMLGSKVTEAYLADNIPDRNLKFKMKRRAEVRMAQASIGLAETRLVVGENGVYRAEQIYRVKNNKEAYLGLMLPQGATLWGVRILTAEEWTRKEQGEKGDWGQPVKACRMEDEAYPGICEDRSRLIQIPLVKTEIGDLDYVVRMVYAGELSPFRVLGKQELPFPKVLYFPVAKSFVRLYLPDQYNYHFDGSLQQLDQGREESVIREAEETYQNLQRSELVQLSNSDSAHARRRAKFNLSSMAGTSSIRKEGDGQIQTMVTPKVIVQEEEEEFLGGVRVDAVFTGNTKALQSQVQSQMNWKSDNVVTKNKNDWNGDRAAKTVPQADREANLRQNAWLETNSLTNPEFTANNAGVNGGAIKVYPIGDLVMEGKPTDDLRFQGEVNFRNDAPKQVAPQQQAQVAQQPMVQQQRQLAVNNGQILLNNTNVEPMVEYTPNPSLLVRQEAPQQAAAAAKDPFFNGDAVQFAQQAVTVNGNESQLGVNLAMPVPQETAVNPGEPQPVVSGRRGGSVAVGSSGSVQPLFRSGSESSAAGSGGAIYVHPQSGGMGGMGTPYTGQTTISPGRLGVTPQMPGKPGAAGYAALPPVSAPAPMAPPSTPQTESPANQVIEGGAIYMQSAPGSDKGLDASKKPEPAKAQETKRLSTRTASLDIEIPKQGKSFVFAAPQGTLELSMRSVPNRLEKRGVQFFVLLLTIALIYAAWRIGLAILNRIGRMTFSLRSHRNLAALVTTLGVLSLFVSPAVFVICLVASAILWTKLYHRTA